MPEGFDLFAETARQLTICNACRYCEGYCAVFPALERRTTFTNDDVLYLSNLCHDCRDCIDACMYAPPHEFAVNLPEVFTLGRTETYQRYSWPRRLFVLLTATGGALLVVLLSTVIMFAAVMLIGAPSRLIVKHTGADSFYKIVPYIGLVIPALVVFLFGLVVWAIGARRFWREAQAPPSGRARARAIWSATLEALTLKWMRGGGAGCYYTEERGSSNRFIFHSLTFWGFLAAVVSTILAAVYQDVLGIRPPFSVVTPPVLFGILGGAMMIVGSTGLLILKRRDRPPFEETTMKRMDYAFIAIIDLASITGMLVLLLRDTPAMGIVFTIHLGAVAALFITAPYSKFVHLVYRFAALMRNQIEARQAATRVEA